MAQEDNNEMEAVRQIQEMIDDYREKTVRQICEVEGMNYNDSSDYANATLRAAKKYSWFADKQAHERDGASEELRLSNYNKEISLQMPASGYNENISLEMESLFDESIYGWWRNIERTVKDIRNNPAQALDHKKEDIERKVKENRDFIIRRAGEVAAEGAVRILANRMNDVEMEYRICKRGKDKEGIKICDQQARMNINEFFEQAERIPNLPDDLLANIKTAKANAKRPN